MAKYHKNVKEFQEKIKTTDFYCFDVESTGLSPVENDIIQFSAIKYGYNGTDFVEKDVLDIYINPGYKIPDVIVELTGITDEMLRNKPTSTEAAKTIAAFFGESPVVMGYNSASFDQAFLNALYNKYLGTDFAPSMHLDVLKMAREKMPKPHKLINMAERIGIAESFSFHSSIDDARATFEVFKHILPMYEESEAEVDVSNFVIVDIKRWKRSETLDRIYINNSLNASVYYDVAKGEWRINCDINEDAVIKKIFEHSNVANEEELVSKIS